MSTEMSQAYEWRGRTMVGGDGGTIGEIEEIYVDEASGQPEWGLVQTDGGFTFVPLAGARPTGEDVQVPVTQDQAQSAPGVEPGEELSQQEEEQLFRHYGLDYTTEGTVTATEQPAGGSGATGDAMTRSEEEVRVGKAARERGRARLRKYVVTEEVQQTVPVQREEVRLEREPVTEANVDDATAGPEISEDEHEVVLHEEEPVVEKRTVPKERVRLGKETVTEEQQVSEEVRKEQIEAEGERPPGAA